MKIGIEIEFKTTQNGYYLADKIREAGVNCEMQGYNHRTQSVWKLVTDASVQGGYELVSPPLVEDQFYQIDRVCAVLQAEGCKIRKDCGLHVHHDARDLGVEGFKNVARLWVKYEGAIDQIMPASRRGNTNTYCRTNRSGMLKDMFTAISRCQDLSDVRRVINPVNRYNKLNFVSYWRHGTIEFRHHSGTIEAEKIRHWVTLTAGIIRTAKESKRINTIGADNFDHVLWMAKDRATKKFYRQRKAALSV